MPPSLRPCPNGLRALLIVVVVQLPQSLDMCLEQSTKSILCRTLQKKNTCLLQVSQNFSSVDERAAVPVPEFTEVFASERCA